MRLTWAAVLLCLITPQVSRADDPNVVDSLFVDAAEEETPKSKGPIRAMVDAVVAQNGPVKVKIKASSAAFVGDKVYFNLEEQGNVSSRIWSMFPKEAGLDDYDQGRTANFASRKPGTYVFLVSVAGSDGSVSHDVHVLDYYPALPGPEIMPSKTSPANVIKAQDVHKKPSITQAIVSWTADVKSPNKKAEMSQLASALRQAAGSVNSGVIQINNVVSETRGMCLAALGGSAGAWQTWLERFESQYKELDKAGYFRTKLTDGKVVDNPQNKLTFLNNVAQTLDRIALATK